MIQHIKLNNKVDTEDSEVEEYSSTVGKYGIANGTSEVPKVKKLRKTINFTVLIELINNGGERNEKEISNENIERLKEDTAENFISAVSF